jgi:DNA-directed RNA polymerase specialized sigma24 family protein
VDLTVEDVAAVMGCAPGTVKSTLHDARRSLATRLGVSYERS